MAPTIFTDSVWQMSLGERAAIEGVLSALKPRLAVEIGSMEGACLRRIAAHAEEVHSFDLDEPSLKQPDNVTLHTGDSHELLPQFLEQAGREGRNIDFVIVDGDHTPEGVRQDLEDLLNSPAVAETAILIHDTANERVRQGIERVRFAAWPKVAHVELDWVPGRLFAEAKLRNELWYGLGLVLVQAGRMAYREGPVYEQRYQPAGPLLAQIRNLVVEREAAPDSAPRERLRELNLELAASYRHAAELEVELQMLRDRVAGAERAITNITGSASWRLTSPLRAVKRQTGRSRP